MFVWRKIDWLAALGVLAAALALVFGRPGVGEGLFAEVNGFTLEQYHNADAKFLKFSQDDGGENALRIVTSVDEEIRILDLEGETLQTFPELKASWLYAAALPEGESPAAVIAYSSHDNETHLLRLNDVSGFSWSDQTAIKTDTLAIDPMLISVGDGWLLAHTEIEGTINNPDPDGDNGVYTVKLYRADDLASGEWQPVTEIISRKQNLEDGDLKYPGDGELYYFFEMEEYDKGPSQICVMVSEDEGHSWSEPKELLPADADNEMASCERTEDGWRLFYSSDSACVGESYQGAAAYYADFTADFEPVAIGQPLDIQDNESVRFYDTIVWNGERYNIFARNFLTDCDFLLRKSEIEMGE